MAVERGRNRRKRPKRPKVCPLGRKKPKRRPNKRKGAKNRFSIR